MNPISYFPYRHYERSLGAITAYFLRQGYVSEDELEPEDRRYLDRPELPLPAGGDKGIDEQVSRYLRAGDSLSRGSAETPLFGVGGDGQGRPAHRPHPCDLLPHYE
jgi:nitrile hydratase subunit beta